ncbi:hypothetical protein F5876DRAFT_68136 [Lentinula aff. lateritia]|uniref:Uncharacterized protein n=1 Tax=Lentinula aff. lateritia TaxID=2804960 RepID=A0ACC1TRS6_9AGAR|nr:hypothetical protein F5876DRAFT_68136 [Lentinula aff. lateritia]
MYMIRPRSVFAVALAIGSTSSVLAVPIDTALSSSTVVVDGARFDSVPETQQSSCLAHLHQTYERPHDVLVTRRADSDTLSRDLNILIETKNRRSNKASLTSHHPGIFPPHSISWYQPSDRSLGHEQLYDSRTNVRRADGGPVKPSRVTSSPLGGAGKKVTFLENPVSQVKILEASPQSSEAVLAAKNLEEAKTASQELNDKLRALYDKKPMRSVILGRPSGGSKPAGSPIQRGKPSGSPIQPLTPQNVKDMTSEEYHASLFGYRKPPKDTGSDRGIDR